MTHSPWESPSSHTARWDRTVRSPQVLVRTVRGSDGVAVGHDLRDALHFRLRDSDESVRARSGLDPGSIVGPVDHHGGPVDRLRIRGPKGWLGIRTVNFSSLKTMMLGLLKAIRLEAYGDDMIRGAPLLTQPYGNGGVAYAPRYPNNSTTILQRRAYAKACAALARPQCWLTRRIAQRGFTEWFNWLPFWNAGLWFISYVPFIPCAKCGM